MIPNWPPTLPRHVNRNGFVLSEGDGRLISPTDTGPGKMRRRSSAVPALMQCSLTLTPAQVALLRRFEQADTAGGSLPFSFPDPFGGADLLVRFAKDGLPHYQPLAGRTWTASFKLEILP